MIGIDQINWRSCPHCSHNLESEHSTKISLDIEAKKHPLDMYCEKCPDGICRYPKTGGLASKLTS